MWSQIAPLFLTLLIVGAAMFVGKNREQYIQDRTPPPVYTETVIPNIGNVEVLNGCGKIGIADKCKDFLRKHRIDVKSTGNAATFNYRKTLVISRVKDMEVARQVASILKAGEPFFLRTDQKTHDVSVIIGHNLGAFEYE